MDDDDTLTTLRKSCSVAAVGRRPAEWRLLWPIDRRVTSSLASPTGGKFWRQNAPTIAHKRTQWQLRPHAANGCVLFVVARKNAIHANLTTNSRTRHTSDAITT